MKDFLKINFWKAIDAAINAIPGARASLQQDYDVARWKYNKMTPEERKARIDSDITDNGLLLTPEQYFKKRFAPGVSSASYYNAWNDVEVGDGYKSYLSAAAASGANGANGAGLSTTDADVEQSVTIEEDMQSQLADNFKILVKLLMVNQVLMELLLADLDNFFLIFLRLMLLIEVFVKEDIMNLLIFVFIVLKTLSLQVKLENSSSNLEILVM